MWINHHAISGILKNVFVIILLDVCYIGNIQEPVLSWVEWKQRSLARLVFDLAAGGYK